MANKRNIFGTRKQPFNKAGGKHRRKRECKKQMEQKVIPKRRFIIKVGQHLLKKAMKYKSVRDNSTNKLFLINTANTESEKGNRIVNVQNLREKVLEMTLHTASCEGAIDLGMNNMDVLSVSSVTDSGLFCIMSFKCNGCGQCFEIKNSDKFADGKQEDINVMGVWGAMTTGGGCTKLNELLGTLGIPGLPERKFSSIELELTKLWKDVLEEEMTKAGQEERDLAIQHDEFDEGVPAITVVCDGGWSKRTHKHTYNAMSGVGIIFGKRTKKILHIGVRNKLCYICSRAQTKKTTPEDHECFKNWTKSSQSMEEDIILEGFLDSEKRHGVRYMQMVSDGDSNVYASIIRNVPVWGCRVQKLECSNHATKCLLTNLERLTKEKSYYKGKGKLSMSNIIKISRGVRCAIKMRSREAAENECDKSMATQKLRMDIRNAGRHVLGLHDLCSKDFCKYNDDENEEDEEEDVTEQGVLSDQSKYWSDVTKDPSRKEEDILRRGGSKRYENSELKTMLKDIYIILNRLADKAHRLIGNFTSNLAESWMNIRCKFDGGKMFNKNFSGAFYGRCYGAALRSLLGPAWSPQVYQSVTGKRGNSVFLKTYQNRAKKYLTTVRSSKKKENIMKRKKRKIQSTVQSNSKRAKLAYGQGVLDDSEDIPKAVLDERCKTYLSEHIMNSNITEIEKNTRGQSCNELWQKERKVRLTSSNFGIVMSRSVKNNSNKLVKNIMYSKFQGNIFTIRGLGEEENARMEYTNLCREKGGNIKDIVVPGLQVDEDNKFLAASSDGIVISEKGPVGLIEIKTVLQNKKIMIKEAAQSDSKFFIKHEKGVFQLKRNHKYYYQIQGQLNIMKYNWCDFIVRRISPHDMYIERIHRDKELWANVMVPKLTAFYMTHLLPEIVVPRHETITGIRTPALPWFETPAATKKGTNRARAPEPAKDPQPSTSAAYPDEDPQPSTSAAFYPDQHPQPSTSSAYADQDPQPSTSTESRPGTRRRQRRTKFVGRTIDHLWVEDDGSQKWYRGTVLEVNEGKDGDLDAVYQVLYDNDDSAYDVDSLPRDYRDGALKFV